MISISKIGLILSLILRILSPFPLKGSEGGVVEGYTFPPDKVDILIYNFVSKNLTIHCKDKHHDLGIYTLNYEEAYKFSFKPNFLRKVTLYFCSFKWIGGSHYFDIYNEDRDDCSQCAWTIFKKGPCKHYPNYDVCFKWEH
ncbi:uncharacterized protein HKW66_Vig0256950 [Vigna angularis]|uniref:S-protein homolog n=1 Tax=Phaseolus angularis TaxID=3914 RepID=A0A8T0JX41_PHAAN|nr:uncharacterized protein HKW66_Vig0256950 [Vigna angularis]